MSTRAVYYVFAISCLTSIVAQSATPTSANDLCEDLATFSCAPGSYDDGTGRVLGQAELDKDLEKYVVQLRARLRENLKESLNDSDNPHFHDTAMAALGLKHSPDCESEETDAKAKCEQNLLDGLTRFAEATAIPNFAVEARTTVRQGNLRELAQVAQDRGFEDAVKATIRSVPMPNQDPKLMQRVQSEIFPEVRSLVITKLEQLPIESSVRTAMIRKISSITYRPELCEAGTSGSDLAKSFEPNASYYDSNRFCLQPALLAHATSEFTLAFIIAHELAHSIDPCGLATGPKDSGFHYSPGATVDLAEREFPIPHLLSCLRDHRSFSAEPERGVTLQNKLQGRSGDARAACPFGKYDHICEAFADWVATNVLPSYIAKRPGLTTRQRRVGYSNIWRAMCSEIVSMVDPHPPMSKRINAGVLVQPEIRAQMECASPHTKLIYCDPNNPRLEHRSDRTADTVPPPQPGQGFSAPATGGYGNGNGNGNGYGFPQSPRTPNSDSHSPPDSTKGYQ